METQDREEVAQRSSRAGCCALGAAVVPFFVVYKSVLPCQGSCSLPEPLSVAVWLAPVALAGTLTAAALAWNAARLLRGGDHRLAMARLRLAALLVAVPALAAIPVELALVAYGIYAEVAVQNAEKAGVPEAGCGLVLVLFIFGVAGLLLGYIVPALVAGVLLRRAMAALVRATRGRLG